MILVSGEMSLYEGFHSYGVTEGVIIDRYCNTKIKYLSLPLIYNIKIRCNNNATSFSYKLLIYNNKNKLIKFLILIYNILKIKYLSLHCATRNTKMQQEIETKNSTTSASLQSNVKRVQIYINYG